MVLNGANFGAFRKKILDVAPPPRGVFSLPVTARRRPIDDGLYATSYPICRFWLSRPDSLQYLHNERDVYVLHWQLAKYWSDICFKRVAPLTAVLGIAPANLVGFDIGVSALVEGCGPSGR